MNAVEAQPLSPTYSPQLVEARTRLAEITAHVAALQSLYEQGGIGCEAIGYALTLVIPLQHQAQHRVETLDQHVTCSLCHASVVVEYSTRFGGYAKPICKACAYLRFDWHGTAEQLRRFIAQHPDPVAAFRAAYVPDRWNQENLGAHANLVAATAGSRMPWKGD